MQRMEQYFPVRWTNPSQVITFHLGSFTQSRKYEIKRSTLTLLCLALLALALLDDSEVEVNDVLSEGDNITFIVRI